MKIWILNTQLFWRELEELESIKEAEEAALAEAELAAITAKIAAEAALDSANILENSEIFYARKTEELQERPQENGNLKSVEKLSESSEGFLKYVEKHLDYADDSAAATPKPENSEENKDNDDDLAIISTQKPDNDEKTDKDSANDATIPDMPKSEDSFDTTDNIANTDSRTIAADMPGLADTDLTNDKVNNDVSQVYRFTLLQGMMVLTDITSVNDNATIVSDTRQLWPGVYDQNEVCFSQWWLCWY